MKRVWMALVALEAVWIAMLVQRGAGLAVDEIEFFRATRWIGLGQVPFRDFWEHHTPLQWIAFAPFARLFSNGPGAASIVALRWVQMAVWIGIVALLLRIARREGVRGWSALALLLVSAVFTRRAVEYRLDVLANLAYIAAIALVLFGATRSRWIACGALLSLSVLTNMRFVLLVVLTAALLLFWRPEERRWRLNLQALWMAAGVAPVAAAFIGWLMAAGAWEPFRKTIFEYNVGAARFLQPPTLLDAMLAPLWLLDIGGMAYSIAAIAGVVIALRGVRTPGALQFVALLFIASAIAVAALNVQYDYHLQNAWLLALPLVALAIEQLRLAWQRMAAIVAAVSLSVFAMQVLPAFGAEMEYQDAVMTTADRMTRPGERVWDGAGYVLRREPAYRYWFLPSSVRMMAAARALPPYDLRAIATNPPAAIVADYRLRLYLQNFPDVTRFATRHYVPLLRNLWVPGLAVEIGPQPARVQWIAPRAGQYDVYASAAAAGHPWFRVPLRFADSATSERFAIPLKQLPPLGSGTLRWRVDGVAQPENVDMLTLRRGAKVELEATPGVAAGVFLVPHGVDTLCLTPAEPFLF
ncbi:MAG: hypothetical protein M3Q69_07655 [Acidobacteriota bacterium]|nr:hypothetical protein [Acidobacteriota bacterium]